MTENKAVGLKELQATPRGSKSHHTWTFGANILIGTGSLGAPCCFVLSCGEWTMKIYKFNDSPRLFTKPEKEFLPSVHRGLPFSKSNAKLAPIVARVTFAVRMQITSEYQGVYGRYRRFIIDLCSLSAWQRMTGKEWIAESSENGHRVKTTGNMDFGKQRMEEVKAESI